MDDTMTATFVGGKYDGKTTTLADIMDHVWNLHSTPDWSQARAHGFLVPDPECDNCPLVTGYLAPRYKGGQLYYYSK